MSTIVCLRINWNHTAIPLRIASKFFTLEVNPEPEYPFGRKGLGLTHSWWALSKSEHSGMLLLDGDVAIDPLDFDRMLRAIENNPLAVNTAPVILWPVSTHTESWVWGHGRNGRYTAVDYSEHLDVFTFCFTYLPRALIEYCIEDGMDTWKFPNVDKLVCEAARDTGVKVNLVRSVSPKHLNY